MREHLGVVIFSDTAYEVTPPSPDPVELAPIARFFKPHAVPVNPAPFPPRLIENPHFFDNPWSTSYNPLNAFRGQKTSQQVRNEFLANREAVSALNSEDSGSAYLASHKASNAASQLAGQ